MSLVEQQQNMMKSYKEGLANGLTQKEAAKIAQQRTGLSIRTGLPIKGQKPKVEKGLDAYHPVSKAVRFGVYG